MLIFTTEGDVVAEHWRPGDGIVMPWNGAMTTDGRFLDVGTVTKDGVRREVIVGTESFESVDYLLVPFVEVASFVVQSARGGARAKVPFSPQSEWALTPDGRLWSGTSDKYELYLHEADGDTLRAVIMELPPRRVTQADRDAAMEDNDSMVVAALRTYLSGHPLNYGSNIRVLRGNYDFLQLLEWKNAIIQTGTDLYSGIGINHRANGLNIGIPDKSRREDLMSLLDGLGIPESVVHEMTLVILPF